MRTNCTKRDPAAATAARADRLAKTASSAVLVCNLKQPWATNLRKRSSRPYALEGFSRWQAYSRLEIGVDSWCVYVISHHSAVRLASQLDPPNINKQPMSHDYSYGVHVV